MSEISWVKIKTDLFDNEKIKLIESLPEGDTLLVIWIKLICYAGKSNADGYVMISEDIPMNVEEMATVFNRSLNSVRLALKTFEKYRMIEIHNESVKIRNWENHQNIEGMERVRELTRKRVRKYRERQKVEDTRLLEERNVTETLRNGTDKNKNKNKNKIYKRDMYEKQKKTPKYTYRIEHYKLAELLYKQILKNNPNFKKPNLERWANDFRLMIERDNRNGKDIQDLILFSQYHEFWYKNILSADKLRKQFDKLWLEYSDTKGENQKNGRNESRKSDYEQETKYDFTGE